MLWLVMVVIVAGVFVPSFVGAAITEHPADSQFLKKPWKGWVFMVDLVRAAPGADAAAPGSALAISKELFADDRPQPTSVSLAYLDRDVEHRFAVATPQGEQTVTVVPERPVVWYIYGRYGDTAATGVIGLLDLADGTLIFDVRTDLSDG